MNLFSIIISKVSATITAIFISFGIASAPVALPPVADPVQVVVATATSTAPEAPSTSSTIELLEPVVVDSAPVETATTSTPVEVATATPVVVPVTLPTTNEVAPTPAPQTVIIQIQSPEAPVASAPTPTMEKLYQLTKDGEPETIVLDNVNEQAIRDFAEKLNDQINWRKQAQRALFAPLTQALKANGYNVIEK